MTEAEALHMWERVDPAIVCRPERSPIAWLALVIVCCCGCSGSGPPGANAGSMSQMQRQIEAATAARAKAAKQAARAAPPAKKASPTPEAEKPPEPEPESAPTAVEIPPDVVEEQAVPAPLPVNRHVALAPDGSLVAMDGEGAVHLWGLPSGASIKSFPMDGQNPSALAVHSQRQLLAVASADGVIRLWRFGGKADDGLDEYARQLSNDLQATLLGHVGGIRSLAFDYEGEQLISAGDDGVVRVWQTSSLPPRAFAVANAACEPVLGLGGKTIAVATDDRAVELVPLGDPSRARLLQQHEAPLTALALAEAKNVQLLLSGDERGGIHVWDFLTGREEQFFGHSASITRIGFDAKGSRIVSAAGDGTLRIANHPGTQPSMLAKLPRAATSLALTPDHQEIVVNTGAGDLSAISLGRDNSVRQLPIAGQGITVHAVAHGGRSIVAGTASGVVRCLSVADGTKQAEFAASRGAIESLAMHPDGARCAVADDEGTIRILRLPDGADKPSFTLEATLEGHSGAVHSLRFVGDGQLLVSAGGDDTVRLWGLKQGNLLETFSTEATEASQACATANGAIVFAACGNKTLLVFHRDDEKPRVRLPVRGQLRTIAVGPTGRLAVGMADGSIQLWDVDQQIETERLEGHTRPVEHLVFLGDRQLISSAADKTVRLWNLAPTVMVRAHRGAIHGLQVVEENGNIITGGDDRRLCVWSAAGSLIREAELNVRISKIARHPRRNQIAYACDDSFTGTDVGRWRFDDGKSMEPLHTPAAVKALAYSSDGSRLAVAGADGIVRVYDSQGQALLEQFSAETNVAALLFGPGDGGIITAERDGIVRRYSLRLKRFFSFDKPAMCAIFSPDREFALAGAADGVVRLSSLVSSAPPQDFKGHTSAVAALFIPANGKHGFSASLDGTVRAWPLPHAAMAGPSTDPAGSYEHPAAVRSLTVSTTGGTLLTGSDDGVARVWDLAAGRVRESYIGEPSPVIAACFLDTDAAVLVCNGDGKWNRWKRTAEGAVAKGASPDLGLPDAQELLLSPPAAGLAVGSDSIAERGETLQAGTSRLAAYEQFLRSARLNVERDRCRKQIASVKANTARPQRKSPKKAAAQIGHGAPWNLEPAASLETDFAFASTPDERMELAISSDANLLAAAQKPAAAKGVKTNGVVRVWDLPTGTELRRWSLPATGHWRQMRFAGANDAFLYTLPDTTAYELATGTARHFSEDCLAVALPGDDELLFGRSTRPLASGELLLRIDGDTFETTWKGFTGYETAVTALACSPDGRWAAVGVRERLRHKLVLFDMTTMSVSAVLDEAAHAKPWVEEGPLGITDVVFSADGKRLLFQAQYGPDDWRTATALATGDGYLVAEKTIVKRKESAVVDHQVGYVAGEVDRIYLGTSKGLTLLEGKSGKPVAEMNLEEIHGGQVKFIVSPDGAWIASADDGGKVSLWDLMLHKRPVNTFTAHVGPVVGLAFSADGRWLVTAGEENRIRLWDFTAVKERRLGGEKRNTARRP